AVAVGAELRIGGARIGQLADALAKAREDVAGLRGQLEGARAAIADEKAHTQQRLADQRETYETQLTALRTGPAHEITTTTSPDSADTEASATRRASRTRKPPRPDPQP
ncbi:MAG: hypothetical protein L0I24_11525, partial [Pseudonocardia sp.]|nr:hypothetical protein [Pseudonocardia sp.]